jgi:protein ImuA
MPVFHSPVNQEAAATVRQGVGWTFGDPALDAAWPTGVLDHNGVHELKPAGTPDWAVAVGMALRLAARRLATVTRGEGERPFLLWCATAAFTAEHGRLHVPGLATLGLTADALLVVDAARERDVLWALEEGLRSRAPAVVVGGLDKIGATASRRLSLAAAEAGVPCLLVTAPGKPAAPVVTTRWRLQRMASTPHPFDPMAPGAPRSRITLERCRGVALAEEGRSRVVEWCDGAHRFRLAAGLADRQAPPGVSWTGSPVRAFRAG